MAQGQMLSREAPTVATRSAGGSARTSAMKASLSARDPISIAGRTRDQRLRSASVQLNLGPPRTRLVA